MNYKKILRTLGAVAFWLLLWTLISWKVNRAVLIPSPKETALRFIELAGEKQFYLVVLRSLVNILAGFAAGTVFAVLAAVVCHASKTADALLSPAMTVIRSTPVASFIILALVFIGKKFVPTLICFMMVSPVIFSAVSNGIRLRDKDNLEMLNVFNVGFLRKLFSFQLPSLLPFLAEGCSNALGLAWKAGIAAEVLCTPQDTIGIKLYESKLYLETTDVFCWTLVVILMSLLLEAALKRLMGKMKRGGTADEKN